MSSDAASLYSHHLLFSWWHLFWEMSTAPHHDTATSIHHSCGNTNMRWCPEDCRPPFFSKHNNDHYGETAEFWSSGQRMFIQERRSLSPRATADWGLSFLLVVVLEWRPSSRGSCWHINHCPVVMFYLPGFSQHWFKVHCCSGVHLDRFYQNTFIFLETEALLRV